MIRKFRVLLASVSFFVFAFVATSHAEPTDDVRICDIYGTGWYYIPGTDRCLKPTTGEIRYETEAGTVFDESELAKRIRAAESELLSLSDQVAISNALQAPDLIQGETFGVKFNWGTSGDSNALGITGALVLVPNTGSGRVAISGGAAFTGREIGGTAGLQFSW